MSTKEFSPSEQSAYIEARFTLIEELFAQMFGFLPLEAAEAFASGYNDRRAAILGQYKPDQLQREVAEEAARKNRQKPSLVVVPSSNLILP